MLDLRKYNKLVGRADINSRFLFLAPNSAMFRKIEKECKRVGGSYFQRQISNVLLNMGGCLLEPHICVCLADSEKSHCWIADVQSIQWRNNYDMQGAKKMQFWLVLGLQSISYISVKELEKYESR